jgi:hypothetical protein
LPLSEKTRIEVYLPDTPRQAYRDLLLVLEQEFTFTFGGCTLVRGLEGSYLSQAGLLTRDRINLLYTDTMQAFEANFALMSRYTDALRNVAVAALDEEAVLIAVHKVYHAQ